MAIIGFILSFFINLNGKGFVIAGIIISAVSIVITVIYIIVAVALVASAL